MLGESQSGEMQEIGFNLYSTMLDAAVRVIERGEGTRYRTSAWESLPKSTCMFPALLPDDYCSDVHERLVLYKRMANCTKRRTAGRYSD